MESLLYLQIRVPGLSKLRYPGVLCYQQHKEPGVCIMQERKPSPNGAGKQCCLNCRTSSNTTENDTPAVLFSL